MVKYENSKIYKIVDNTNGNIYIGSTVKTLSQRLGQHRASYKMFLKGNYNNIKSFEIIKNGDYDIILLEECQNITNKDQLHARERFYIDTLECVNKYRPIITIDEKKEYKKEYNKKYKTNNKEKIKEQKKGYYEAKKEELKQYASEKITCPLCQCEILKGGKTMHLRTKKHQQNIQNLQADTE